MVKVKSNSNRDKDDREELSYPGSPRSQKWIGNLLPVLERYNYNYAEIVQLVKACDYNGEKIQQEVDRIMEINIGHEQGEWTVVKPQQRVKSFPSTKGERTVGNGMRRDAGKNARSTDVKPPRRQRNVREVAQTAIFKETVEIVTTAAPVLSVVAAAQQHSSEKERTRTSREKKEGREARKDAAPKEIRKEPQKLNHQPGIKKALPVQWASLLKKPSEDDTSVPATAPPPPPAAPPENTQAKAKKKPIEKAVTEPLVKAVAPESKRDVEAVALAQAEEALKKLEVSERTKVEQPSQNKLLPPPKQHHPDHKPQQQRSRPATVEVDEVSPVIMPRPLPAGIDASAMFTYFDEEPPKTNVWTPTSPVASYQQSSVGRRDHKYFRGSHLGRADHASRLNMLHHDGSALVAHDPGNMQQHEQLDSWPGYGSHMQQDSAHDGNFHGHWQMGYYGNRYSNPKHQAFTYGYENDKHKTYRQGGHDHYGPKDNRHHVNGVYVNYGYQHERIQSPPGLVGFYTAQQPFYGFPNSAAQGCNVVSSEVCVIWASTVVSKRGFQQDELLHIARSFARSEYSRLAVQIVLLSPFSLCRIYSNGRVIVMGNLTELQAREQLKRVLCKLRYRTKWKVMTQPGEVSHGNGLQWCYLVNKDVLPVKAAVQEIKIDQIYCKVVFDVPLDLRLLHQKGIDTKHHITKISGSCLRLQIDLPQPQGESLPKEELDPAPVWDAGVELERELELELTRIATRKNRFATCIIYKSGKLAILGCCSREEIRFAFGVVAKLL
ncbi:uncharacterized protein BXIN_2065 [Babesia sp. Xinjiang]|uniref:uncharacterized protein n=1 Tax=Babesia sp. Xinjiang TaxID=462227 RepID=UPI000A2554FE|nr:uncharacterized protein BXIN_2065 [Babesia sp. Xinjiang]ORM40599.1 hypothetical protein BXIN_2065 [Babesia sp. Xinjiang]